MANTGHSEFPASSAYRLLACPGSFELGRRLGPVGRRSTPYSAQGTLAHAMCEAAIYAGADPDSYLGREFTADEHTFVVDQEFVDNVRVYIEYVQGLRALGYLVALETRVSPQWCWDGLPDTGLALFGTADCIAYHPTARTLAIVDLKFGYGLVEVEDNAQLRYYGTGALDPKVLAALAKRFKLPEPLDVDSIETVIVQPRAPHPDGRIRRATYTPADLISWARTELYQGVERAVTDNGQTCQAGDHCKFCPALPHCETHQAYQNQLAREAFAAMPVEMVMRPASPAPSPAAPQLPDVYISNAKLADMLARMNILSAYKGALEQLAVERIQGGQDVPGFKVVKRRSRRQWGDDDAKIIAALHNAGLPTGHYLESSLRSPAQVERLVGAKTYRDLVKPMVTAQSSGVNLVPDGDPRDAIAPPRTAQEAFAPLLPPPQETPQ